MNSPLSLWIKHVNPVENFNLLFLWGNVMQVCPGKVSSYTLFSINFILITGLLLKYFYFAIFFKVISINFV